MLKKHLFRKPKSDFLNKGLALELSAKYYGLQEEGDANKIEKVVREFPG